MKQGILGSTAKQAQQIAQRTAKQLGEEPFEIAKTASQQIVGVESGPAKVPVQFANQPIENSSVDVKALQETDKARSQAMYANLQNELRNITRNKAEKESADISAETQQLAAKPYKEVMIEPGTKRSRNPLRGMAKKLADLGKKAEIRMPPSG